MNTTAVNILVRVFVWMEVFNSGLIPRSAITRSRGRRMLSFYKKLPNSQSGWTILHSPQQCVRAPIAHHVGGEAGEGETCGEIPGAAFIPGLALIVRLPSALSPGAAFRRRSAHPFCVSPWYCNWYPVGRKPRASVQVSLHGWPRWLFPLMTVLWLLKQGWACSSPACCLQLRWEVSGRRVRGMGCIFAS